jgi:mannosyltransferase
VPSSRHVDKQLRDGTYRTAGATRETDARRPGTDRLRHWLAIIVPALAGLVVGGYHLGGPSLWRDEGYTLNSSQRSISEIFALINRQDAVHGLYYLVMHFVIGAFGPSAVAIRLPSLLAMSVTAAVTAALGRRLARASGLPAPSVTGMAAGLLLVALPLTTYYVEDARPYGLVSMFALISTYALVRGATERLWWWWAVYTVSITLAGAFDIFALLLVAAHGVSLVFARIPVPGPRPGTAGESAGARLLRQPLVRWLAAASAAVVLLAPVIYLAYRQAGTLNWIRRPDGATVTGLLKDLAGSRRLLPLAAVLVLCGAAADRGLRRRGGLTLAVVALPWLVLPPLLLLSVSELHPVYTERYVLFSFPALALLSAAGLSRIAAAARRLPVGRRWRALAALPSAALAAVLAVALTGPQLAIRLTSNRTDDLRTVTAIVAAHEQSGDAVLYLPQTTRVVAMAYPAPFQRLRDIGLRQSPASSATLLGVEVSGPVLGRRLADVRRVWTVNWQDTLTPLASDALADEEEALLGHMRLIGQWYVMSVVLSLYAAGSPAS